MKTKMPLEDLALLEVLSALAAGQAFIDFDSRIRQRLFDYGLLAETQNGPELTTAGLELCQSLEHREAAGLMAAASLMPDTEGS